MCLIVISGRSFSGAELLARRVSEELGYRWIEENAVIESAAAWGIPQEQLRAVVRPPVPQRCFRQGTGLEVVALRAALAAEAAASEAVFSGREAFLLPRDTVPVLRIRLSVSLEDRVANLNQRLNLADLEAKRRIRREDRDYCQWVRRVSGLNDDDPRLYDFVVNLQDGNIESACKTIAAFVLGQRALETGAEYRKAMADFALACRIEMALKVLPHTAHLNASVRADRGLVILAAKRWHPSDRVLIENLVSLVSGVRRVLFVELRREARLQDSLLRKGKPAAWRSWAVGATAWGLLVAGCVFLKHFDASTAADTSLTGVITDTRCAGNHPVPADWEKPQCVRECIKVQNHVKLAVFDGAKAYALSDQGLAEQFAARAVIITGRLDPKTNLLEVRTIRAASGSAKSSSF